MKFETVKLLYDEAKSLSYKAIVNRAKIRARLEQRPAISAQVLEESGLNLMPNINYGMFTASILKRARAVERAFFLSESFVKVLPRKHDPTQISQEVGHMLSVGFSNYLASSLNPFISRVKVLLRDVVAYGTGAFLWQDPRDVIPQVVSANDLLFSALSRTEPGGLNLAFVFRRALEADIERWLSARGGWNVSALRKFKKAIDEKTKEPRVYPIVFAYAGRDITAFSPEVIDKPLGEWPDFAPQEETIVPVYYDTGDGFSISVRGLGHALYPLSMLDDDLLNRAVSASKVALSVMVRPRTEDAMDSSLIDRPPLLVADPRTELEFGHIGSSLEAGLGIRNVLSVLANNLYGIYKAGRELYTTGERTATELSLASRFQNMEEDSLVIDLAHQFSLVYRRIFKAFLKNTKLVNEYVGEVPEAFLDYDMWDVYPNVASQAAEIGGAVAYAGSLLNVLPAEDNSNARSLIKRKIYEAIGGRHLALELMPTREQLPSSEDSRQDVENAVLISGESVAVGANDDHVSHIRRMFEYLDRLLENVNNIDLKRVRFDALLAHLRGHISTIATVPAWKAFYTAALNKLTELMKALNPILSAQQKLIEMAQQTQAVEQNDTQAMTPQTAIKLREMEGRLQIGRYRAQVQAELQRKRLEDKLSLERDKTMRTLQEKEIGNDNTGTQELGEGYE